MRNNKDSNVKSINTLEFPNFAQRFLPDSYLDDAFRPTSAFMCTVESSITINPEDLAACFGLIEATSKESYAASSSGWHPKAKRREMKLPDMKYLLVRERSSASIVGFASFMLTFEDGLEVIYLYEIHLSETARSLGLGKRLVNLVESVGQQAEVKKIMLTIFESNTTARAFYERRGFALDEFSPAPRKLRNGITKYPDYAILSKTLANKRSPID